MANQKHRVASNVDGDFFVDQGCINCGVSRHFAPDTFGGDGSHAFVKTQPATDAEILSAERALLACPVAAIGTSKKHDLKGARDSFPLELAEGV